MEQVIASDRHRNDYLRLLHYIDNYTDITYYRGNFVDVGVHKPSEMVLYASTFAKYTGYEANTTNYKLLSKYFTDIHNFAVSNETGLGILYIDNRPGYDSLKQHCVKDLLSQQEVKIDTLDNLCSKMARVDVLNIDTEQNDAEVLLGGRQIIEKHHPLIVIEQLPDYMIEWLELLGYTITQDQDWYCIPRRKNVN